jgi:putative transposase
LRSERALAMNLAEMYIQGVSTRKVTTIVERLCGTSVSATQASKAIAFLDESLDAWCQRPLCECPYVTLDAHYGKVRQDGQVRDTATFEDGDQGMGVNDEATESVDEYGGRFHGTERIRVD